MEHFILRFADSMLSASGGLGARCRRKLEFYGQAWTGAEALCCCLCELGRVKTACEIATAWYFRMAQRSLRFAKGKMDRDRDDEEDEDVEDEEDEEDSDEDEDEEDEEDEENEEDWGFMGVEGAVRELHDLEYRRKQWVGNFLIWNHGGLGQLPRSSRRQAIPAYAEAVGCAVRCLVASGDEDKLRTMLAHFEEHNLEVVSRGTERSKLKWGVGGLVFSEEDEMFSEEDETFVRKQQSNLWRTLESTAGETSVEEVLEVESSAYAETVIAMLGPCVAAVKELECCRGAKLKKELKKLRQLAATLLHTMAVNLWQEAKTLQNLPSCGCVHSSWHWYRCMSCPTGYKIAVHTFCRCLFAAHIDPHSSVPTWKREALKHLHKWKESTPAESPRKKVTEWTRHDIQFQNALTHGISALFRLDVGACAGMHKLADLRALLQLRLNSDDVLDGD